MSKPNALSSALHLARKRRADGGRTDWRSDMDAPGPGYDPIRGEVMGERRPAMLSEPDPTSDPTRGRVEMLLDALYGYGSMPAKGMVGQFDDATSSVVEAVNDPSIPNVASAGFKTALTFGQPLRAAKVLGAGLGLGAAKDAGLLPFQGGAQAEGLSPDDQKRLAQLRAKSSKQSLNRAERGEMEELNRRISAAAAEEAAARRTRAEFEARVEADAKRQENDARAKIEADRQAEFTRATQAADRGLAEAKANRPKKFSETAVGELYDKAGIAAPGILALGAGALTRSGMSIKGPSKWATPAGIASGTGTGVATAHWPLGHSLLFEPAYNPEKKMYSDYARDLPLEHPRKAERTEYARSLPDENPERALAAKEFYDPVKAAERSAFGAIEGILGGLGGAEAAKWVANAPRAALRSIGEGIDATRAAGRSAQVLSAGRADAKQSALAVAEARRRKGAQRVAPASAPEADLPGLPPPAAASSSSRSSSSPPKVENGDTKAKRQVKKPPLPSEKEVKEVEKALKSRGLPEISDAAPTPWRYGEPFAHGGAAHPTVIVKTPRKGGGWYTRNEDGKFRGGRVVDKKAEPTPTERGLEIARRYANGGAVTIGPVVGATGGRADELPVSVPSGSFVIPADIVSGLGEGNTLAGMRKLEETFGAAKPSGAGGGPAVPIKISDGEFVLTPEQVAQIGGGDMDTGHKILDQLVVKLRQQIVNHMANLPPPSK